MFANRLVSTTLIILLVNQFTVLSQTRSCGSDNYWKNIRSKDKTAGLDLTSFKSSVRTDRANTIITIPVVVHVLYNTVNQNISDQQIQSQIDVLNKDYRKLNADATNVPSEFSSVIADCEIQFCLAQQDPYGLPTNGITRTATSKTSFSNNLDDAKSNLTGGKDGWNPDNYLNLWVVPAITSSASSTILGYSSFPQDGKSTDGVVIGYKYFGTIGSLNASNNLGRTATHEIGHWLGLYHTFQDGCVGTNSNTCTTKGDLVCDTPPTSESTYGCPSTKNSCTETPEQNDMTMNFMDYVDDKCMYMFTMGQKNRMWYHLNTYRSAIFSSKGCTAPVLINDNIALKQITNSKTDLCDPSFTPTLDFINIGSNTANSLELEYGTPNNINKYTWSGSLASGSSNSITLNPINLAFGLNDFYVKIIKVNGNADNDTTKNELHKAISIRKAINLPFTEDFENINTFAQNWTIVNYNYSLEWQRTNLASASGNYSIFADNTNGTKNGEIDDIVGPLFYIQQNASLNFKYAYKLYTQLGTDTRDFSDTLRIFLDVDCGGNPTQIFEGYGKDFTTGGDPYFWADQFIPTANDWKNVSVDLSAFEGKKARLILRNLSDIENSLFIDDINMTDSPLSVVDSDQNNATVKVFPTISNGTVNVTCDSKYEVEVYNSTGQLISTRNSNIGTSQIDIASHTSSFFIFKIKTEQSSQSFKIIKQDW